MKLEKREITLNESDSLADMLATERALLNGYCASLCRAERKETRAALSAALSRAAEEIFFLTDLSGGDALRTGE